MGSTGVESRGKTDKKTTKPAKPARSRSLAGRRQPSKPDFGAILRFDPDRLPGQERLRTADLIRAAMIEDIVEQLQRTPTELLIVWIRIASQHTYREPLPGKDGA